jgi:hypothetical protein
VDFPRASDVGEHRAVSDQKSPVDRTLDLFVFAPLGLALSARELVPKLAEQGRQQVQQQVTTARFVGEFAVRRLRRRADAALVELGLTPEQRMKGAPSSTPPSRLDASPAPSHAADGNGQVGAGADRGPRADPSALAIPGYDTLSASQVVQRLTGLTRPELEAVRAYEEAGRGRKTILTRVAQLQAASG